MRHHIYISAPMRGYPHCNFPLLDCTAISLRARGHVVMSPAEMDRELGFDGEGEPPINFIRVAFPRDVAAIAQCSAILMLPGWRHSEGARIEHDIAMMMNLTMYYDLSEVPTATLERTPHAHDQRLATQHDGR